MKFSIKTEGGEGGLEKKKTGEPRGGEKTGKKSRLNLHSKPRRQKRPSLNSRRGKKNEDLEGTLTERGGGFQKKKKASQLKLGERGSTRIREGGEVSSSWNERREE